MKYLFVFVVFLFYLQSSSFPLGERVYWVDNELKGYVNDFHFYGVTKMRYVPMDQAKIESLTSWHPFGRFIESDLDSHFLRITKSVHRIYQPDVFRKVSIELLPSAKSIQIFYGNIEEGQVGKLENLGSFDVDESRIISLSIPTEATSCVKYYIHIVKNPKKISYVAKKVRNKKGKMVKISVPVEEEDDDGFYFLSLESGIQWRYNVLCEGLDGVLVEFYYK